jgi:peptidoglycan/xylan/chitin deacetylase (PgdA/CDA1 family)
VPHESLPSLVLSIDLDEWYHSRRWLDGQQAASVPDTRALFRRIYGQDTPAGDVIEPTRSLLDLFARHRVRCTFFVLGEMGVWYPDLVKEIARRGHEIACHGMHHVDMTVLGPAEFARQLQEARSILSGLTGSAPIGYRAPNLVYESWATAILESQGFMYDSTVCVSRSIGGKYRGWSHAPEHPYRPSYDNVAERGAARLIELPLPTFPVIRLSAGSGIVTRILGYHWTAIALSTAIRRGDTGYYFHPWEVGPRPPSTGSRLKSAIFLRRTGPWMMETVDRLLSRFSGRVLTAREAAERCRIVQDSPVTSGAHRLA